MYTALRYSKAYRLVMVNVTVRSMNGDIYNNVFPTLNHLHLPNTKITIKDYSEEFKDFYSSSIAKQYGTEWYKNCGSYFNILKQNQI